MKSKIDHIGSFEQNTQDIDGYYYEGADGTQMAFWTCYSNRASKKHTHAFGGKRILGHADGIL